MAGQEPTPTATPGMERRDRELAEAERRTEVERQIAAEYEKQEVRRRRKNKEQLG